MGDAVFEWLTLTPTPSLAHLVLFCSRVIFYYRTASRSAITRDWYRNDGVLSSLRFTVGPLAAEANIRILRPGEPAVARRNDNTAVGITQIEDRSV